jgi:glycosyltransferase involved in cell wall biosynthesis
VEENRQNEDSPALRTRQHICVVSETFFPQVNGVALTLGHLVKGLLDLGHQVSIVRPRQRRSESGGLDPSVTTVAGLPLPGYKGLQFGLPAGALLQQLWMRCRPDAAYVATEGPLGWSAVSVARRLAIPVFSGFHTNFHSYSRYYGVGYLGTIVLRYLRWFHNRTRGTLVPSSDLRDRLITLGFKKVSCLGRGVDSQLFDPARRCGILRRQWGLGEDDLAVVYVGRIAGEKNLSLALTAYRAIKQTVNCARFVVVGDGPLRSSLEAQNADVIFSGMQLGPQLAAHYASADLFLFPSETETFGNVVLEAMASGLAVIAYDYAAAGCHIADGETGILVPLGESKAFVAAAVQLASQPGKLKRVRRQAREYSTSIGWSRVVERFAALLNENDDQVHSPLPSLVGRRNLAAAARGRI